MLQSTTRVERKVKLNVLRNDICKQRTTEELFARLGLHMSTVLNTFLKQAVHCRL
nr:hypothetical protein [Gleimia europaea]